MAKMSDYVLALMEEGATARIDGERPSANPYVPLSEPHRLWLKGYNLSAMDEPSDFPGTVAG